MKYVILLIFCKKLVSYSSFSDYDINLSVNVTNLTIVEKLDDSLAKLLNIPNVDVSEETHFWNHTIWNNETILKLATYKVKESKEDSLEEYEDYEEEENREAGKERKKQQVKDDGKKEKTTGKFDKFTTLRSQKKSAEEAAADEMKVNITMMEMLLHNIIFDIETKKIRSLIGNISTDEIVKHLKTLKHCFVLARDDKRGGYDEYLRNSSQLLYNKSGPEFIRVGIHNLLEEYAERQLLSDRDINIISELFDEAFNAWYELRRHILYEEKAEQDKEKHSENKKQLF